MPTDSDKLRQELEVRHLNLLDAAIESAEMGCWVKTELRAIWQMEIFVWDAK